MFDVQSKFVGFLFGKFCNENSEYDRDSKEDFEEFFELLNDKKLDNSYYNIHYSLVLRFLDMLQKDINKTFNQEIIHTMHNEPPIKDE